MSDNIDPGAVHALSGAILDFLDENKRVGVSLEIQVAALKVAAATIDESMNAFNAAVTRDNLRNMFKKR